ncbi:MAG: glutathionylspermidine synthase family protein [Lachnospiraceae bacterium]|nr:glutathionylspermidine synthase family protein [Lachnospiraceae bacterium]
MKLIPIPKENYEEYRRNLMFGCYKWDPQFVDNNTIARYALVLTKDEQQELATLTEQLDAETRAAEEYLIRHQELAGPLAFSKKLKRELKKMTNYQPEQHVRLMRYDFHPTIEGEWAVSEVNSDVPGGFAESSLMPMEAMKYLSGEYDFVSFGESMVKALVKKLPSKGRIMMVHCTSYSDDRQVMQYLGDRLEEQGLKVIYGAADHLQFADKRAYSVLDGNEGKVDAIFRFTPLEWVIKMRPRRWQGYFDTITLSCNHPVAMYAQTKRFPFVWDVLEQKGVSMATWRKLLPETLEVKAARGREGFLYKPVYGRVGEKISIKEACRGEEYKKIMKDVKKHPRKYLAQKRFISKPLQGVDGEEYHVCLGSYAVEGKHAGFYARISSSPRIDSHAADIPVLVEGMGGCRKSLPDNSNALGARLYDIWAPVGKKWVDWVRPVPFLEIEHYTKGYSMSDRAIPEITCVDGETRDTAVIVDLPGGESVVRGLGLAKKGFRPVPVFNGTLEQEKARATVDNQSAGMALLWAAEKLAGMELPKDAPPAFLTDTNRLQRHIMVESLFDNSWDVYHQDLPSAEYMWQQGIRKVVLICNKPAGDLKKILYPYRKKGMEILWTRGYEAPRNLRLMKPKDKD